MFAAATVEAFVTLAIIVIRTEIVAWGMVLARIWITSTPSKLCKNDAYWSLSLVPSNT